jgi:hypothetical protein
MRTWLRTNADFNSDIVRVESIAAMRQQETPVFAKNASLSQLSISGHVYPASVAVGDGHRANVWVLSLFDFNILPIIEEDWYSLDIRKLPSSIVV